MDMSNMGKSLNKYAEWKKPDKSYILCDYIRRKF